MTDATGKCYDQSGNQLSSGHHVTHWVQMHKGEWHVFRDDFYAKGVVLPVPQWEVFGVFGVVGDSAAGPFHEFSCACGAAQELASALPVYFCRS